MPRIVLGIEYDGTAYSGWQFQPGKRTIQGELQNALRQIADREVTLVGAGRTDTGVHALEQVAHFDCPAERNVSAWLRGGNSLLPDDTRILWSKIAIGDFHARYSAIARLYRYVILNRSTHSALLRQQTIWCHTPLDTDKMYAAAQSLLGERDFTSFRAHSCQSHSPKRMMHMIDVTRQGDLVQIDICANAFLHHMVRNIVGVLLCIGTGKQPPEWAEILLDAKDRSKAAATAPPQGLHLMAVYYPERYGLGKHPLFNRLPQDARRFDEEPPFQNKRFC